MSLLVRMGKVPGPIGRARRRLADDQRRTRDVVVHARNGPRVARLYRPQQVRTRPVLLSGGVHALGIEEPRLIAFAETLAQSGTPVITPALPDLKEYLVTPRLTDDIEDAALAMLAAPEVPQHADGRIGLLGISFAGGLSIIAAGRPSLRDRVGFVFSVGGHARLPGVMRYICTGVQPDGRTHPPHDYGSVILLTNMAEDVVPARSGGRVARRGAPVPSRLARGHVRQAAGGPRVRQGTHMEADLPAEARAFMHLVNTRDVPGLGRAPAALSRSLGPGGCAVARPLCPLRGRRCS